MQITNQLAKWRQKNKLTQAQLASFVNVSRQTIIAIEKGDYTPSLLLGMKIAYVFKVKVEQIFQLVSKHE